MKNVLILAPKTIKFAAFRYNGIEDLPNLIKFVGTAPQIDTQMTLTFPKKQVVKAGNIVVRDSFGNVTNVMTEEQIKNFDLVAEADFNEKTDTNKVQEKPAKVKKEKTPKAKK